MLKSVAILIFSLLFYLSGYYTLVNKIEPFHYFFYVTSWWSYIIFLDAALAMKEKRFLLLNRHITPLIIISCGFWCIFELINIRIRNWYYIDLPVDMVERYGGYLFAYGTVIPAIYLTKEWFRILFGDVSVRPFRIKGYPLYAIAFGIAMLLLTLILPRYLFASTWVFAALIMDALNYIRGYGSFMADFEKGRAGHFISAVAAGLVCGILWEMWNYLSISKWIYSVPFLEKGKIFEMPLPGYLGFLTFGLETIAFFNFFEGARKDARSVYVLFVVIAILVSCVTFPLIDRWTVRW